MITREEAERVRGDLLRALEEDAHNTERLLARLDSIASEGGVEAHAALLLILTRLTFDNTEARTHWDRILAHREAMASALGRVVGVRVAIFDYFVNANRRMIHPNLLELEMFPTGERATDVDPLSGLSNDRAFRAAVQSETRRARRYGQHVSVVLFDLDDFGELNHRVGVVVGDRILREAAILLGNTIRDIDIAARPGEDELAAVLPETDRVGALLVAERFRREVEAHFSRRDVQGQPVNLTVSGGICCYPEDASAPEILLQDAAQALYRAKATGKNVIAVFQPERRRFLRFDLAPGRFEIEILAPTDVRCTRPRNLSRSGIVFASPERLEVGEAIELRLVEPAQGSPVEVRGQVVRLEEIPPLEGEGDARVGAADRYEVGVAFDAEESQAGRGLMRFLEQARSGKRG
jgi:diguanylate cyclase (GGDEF)-like protein